FLGDYCAAAQAQQFQHPVFFAREIHANPINVNRLGIDIDDEITDLDDRLGMSLRPAHDGVDASDQFSFLEALGHRVVGAIANALDLVLDGGDAGEDQNRGLNFACPQGSQYLKARHVGKVQMEQDDVVIVKSTEIDTLFPEICRINVEALT